MKRLLILVFLFSGIFFTNVPSVLACSGGYYSERLTIQDLVSAPIFIRGTVSVNNAGNSIIEVDQYFIGEGSDRLLLYRQSPEYYHVRVIRQYAFGCNYAESPVDSEGSEGYFALYRSNNGTVHLGYPHWDYYIPIQTNDAGEEYVSHTIADETQSENESPRDITVQNSIDEFEELLISLTGQNATQPLSRHASVLRFRALYVTTESGQRYVMPVNRNTLTPLGTVSTDTDDDCSEDCIIISPDGSHFTIPVSNQDNTYGIWYFDLSNASEWWEGVPDYGDNYQPTLFTAHHIMYSPDSNLFLAWYDSTLSLYRITPTIVWSGDVPTVSLIWQTDLATNEILSAEQLHGQAVWSGDSGTLAYWDADGLHWFDLDAMPEPHHVLNHADTQTYAQAINTTTTTTDLSLPSILELSTTGRYIRYGTAQEWQLMDILTRIIYDDAVVSPDETTIIQVAPETFAQIDGVTYDYCRNTIPFCHDSIRLHGLQVEEVHWHHDRLIVFACETENTDLCQQITYTLSPDGTGSNIRHTPRSYASNDFAYDTVYDYAAWAVDDYSIYSELPGLYTATNHDYSDILDSPIASIEWGTPLWYVGN